MKKIVNWLKREWKQSKCEHQFEILAEYNKMTIHTSHYSWDDTFRLYCPYCELEIEETKVDYDLNKKEKSEESEIERRKAEIKKRVLGVKQND